MYTRPIPSILASWIAGGLVLLVVLVGLSLQGAPAAGRPTPPGQVMTIDQAPAAPSPAG